MAKLSETLREVFGRYFVFKLFLAYFPTYSYKKAREILYELNALSGKCQLLILCQNMVIEKIVLN